MGCRFSDIAELGYIDSFDFWSNARIADSDTCWEWLGKVVGNYAVYRGHLANRIAWHLSGNVLADAVVYHSCCNPRCVNPFHLRTGSVDDLYRKFLDACQEANNAPAD